MSNRWLEYEIVIYRVGSTWYGYSPTTFPGQEGSSTRKFLGYAGTSHEWVYNKIKKDIDEHLSHIDEVFTYRIGI